MDDNDTAATITTAIVNVNEDIAEVGDLDHGIVREVEIDAGVDRVLVREGRGGGSGV